MSQPIFFTTALLHKKMLSQDIMELRFERPVNFTFLAGQFVQFQVPFQGSTLLRPYSMSSALQDEYLEFCVKILPEGKASKLFLALMSGDAVHISSAQGVFICRSDHRSKKMFIATGTGLAPIISMIEDRLERAGNEKLSLLFGVRFPEDVFWTDRLDEIQGSYNNFKYQLTLSRPSDVWAGLRGRVSEHLSHLPHEAEYYICGSVEMVKNVRSLLIAHGVDTKSIHFEIF
ncbi:MAG: hypothetical protein EXS55_03060 [Candidatus Magasanikbacteria bacterium]|nr:hypothetical protein [Candidatus Magasanikbacteria bacterium]